MDISQYALLLLHLYAVVLGGGLGILYDGFRVTQVFFGANYSRQTAKRIQQLRLPLLTSVPPKKNAFLLGIVVFLEDLLFCIVAAIAAILLCYEMNDGAIRLLALFCCGVGFLLYRFTVGRMIFFALEWIAFGLSCAFRYGFLFIRYPVFVLCRFFKKLLSRFGRAVLRRSAKLQRRVYTHRIRRRADLDACGILPEKHPNHIHRMGEKNGKRKKKAIQSQPIDQNSGGSHCGRFPRHICK